MKNSRSTKRQEAERLHRRQLLLTAAESVFSRKPFDECSMQDISDEAGIGMQGLYAHFPSKQELFEQVVLLRISEVKRLAAEASAGTSDPRARLRAIAIVFVSHFLEHPQFFPIWLGQKLNADWRTGSRFSHAVDGPIREIEALLAEAIAAAVKARVLQPLDSRLLTHLAFGVFNSVMQHALTAESKPSAEECVTRIMNVVLTGVGRS